MPLNRIVNPKLYKKNQKELKKGLAQKTAPDLETVPRYPAKLAKKFVANTVGALKTFESKKAKKHSKRSKRASTKEVDARSPRAISHKEGKRWAETLKVQTAEKTRMMKKQGLKRGLGS